MYESLNEITTLCFQIPHYCQLITTP